jgi:hypothetical protein
VSPEWFPAFVSQRVTLGFRARITAGRAIETLGVAVGESSRRT